jgi:hypothetical protein
VETRKREWGLEMVATGGHNRTRRARIRRSEPTTPPHTNQGKCLRQPARFMRVSYVNLHSSSSFVW